jgi:hypothetical protein
MKNFLFPFPYLMHFLKFYFHHIDNLARKAILIPFDETCLYAEYQKTVLPDINKYKILHPGWRDVLPKLKERKMITFRPLSSNFAFFSKIAAIKDS